MNNEMQVFFKIRQNYRDFACERGSSKNLGKICIKKNLGISELFALKYTYLLTSFSHQLFEAASCNGSAVNFPPLFTVGEGLHVEIHQDIL